MTVRNDTSSACRKIRSKTLQAKLFVDLNCVLKTILANLTYGASATCIEIDLGPSMQKHWQYQYDAVCCPVFIFLASSQKTAWSFAALAGTAARTVIANGVRCFFFCCCEVRDTGKAGRSSFSSMFYLCSGRVLRRLHRSQKTFSLRRATSNKTPAAKLARMVKQPIVAVGAAEVQSIWSAADTAVTCFAVTSTTDTLSSSTR